MMGLRKPALAAVTELLEIQKTALLNGDLERLSTMEESLGRALKRLKSVGTSHEELARVRERAGRNAVLLRAAQVGLASARAQVTTRKSGGFTTYDAHGQSKENFASTARTLARR